MATNNSAQRRARNGGSGEQDAEVGIEAARNAQETIIRSLGTGGDTVLTFIDVGQDVTRELVSLTVAGTKQALRMSADVLGSVLDGFHSVAAPVAEGRVAFRGWQRVLDGSAQAVGRFAEEMQGNAEAGTDRIKQAVEVLANQVKETAAEVAEVTEEQSHRTSRAASSKR